jgi:hypothetical protein
MQQIPANTSYKLKLKKELAEAILLDNPDNQNIKDRLLEIEESLKHVEYMQR